MKHRDALQCLIFALLCVTSSDRSLAKSDEASECRNINTVDGSGWKPDTRAPPRRYWTRKQIITDGFQSNFISYINQNGLNGKSRWRFNPLTNGGDKMGLYTDISSKKSCSCLLNTTFIYENKDQAWNSPDCNISITLDAAGVKPKPKPFYNNDDTGVINHSFPINLTAGNVSVGVLISYKKKPNPLFLTNSTLICGEIIKSTDQSLTNNRDAIYTDSPPGLGGGVIAVIVIAVIVFLGVGVGVGASFRLMWYQNRNRNRQLSEADNLPSLDDENALGPHQGRHIVSRRASRKSF